MHFKRGVVLCFVENPDKYGINRHISAINYQCIFCWFQRRYIPTHVTFIPVADVLDKGGEISIKALVLQLVIAPPGALFGAGGEVNLEWRAGEYHGAHIAAVGD